MKHYIDRITAGALDIMIESISEIQDSNGIFRATISIPLRVTSNIWITGARGGITALSTCGPHHQAVNVKLASVKKTGTDYSVVLEEAL